jgi:hypothetical protein
LSHTPKETGVKNDKDNKAHLIPHCYFELVCINASCQSNKHLHKYSKFLNTYNSWQPEKEFGTDKKTSNRGKEKHPTLKKTELMSSLNDSVDHIHVQDLQQQQCIALPTYCNNPTNFINS